VPYTLALHLDPDGVIVRVPGLPGRRSQGATEAEAIAAIREAIPEYLAARGELLRGARVRGAEIAA
jgi:predicted RNase H-like HicB family nuclease